MGAVYEAAHQRLGTRVAIKVLHAEIASRPGIVERFLQESRPRSAALTSLR
jgi:serine/threonine protein kinase